MSKQKEYIYGYKNDHKTIKSMSVLRLKTHLSNLQAINGGFYCSCCGELKCYIDKSINNEIYLSELSEFIKYKHFIVREIKSRPNYKEIIDNYVERRRTKSENRNNKGSKKLSKTKRKLLK